jgi:hypothetical protein
MGPWSGKIVNWTATLPMPPSFCNTAWPLNVLGKTPPPGSDRPGAASGQSAVTTTKCGRAGVGVEAVVADPPDEHDASAQQSTAKSTPVGIMPTWRV